MGGEMDGWGDGWVGRWMGGEMDGWGDGWVEKWMGGEIDGWGNGWVGDERAQPMDKIGCKRCAS